MAYIGVLNAAGDTIYIEVSSGAGTTGDPYVSKTVLGTGAAAIGKLAANSGVDIGDTDITSIVPGTAATNLGKAEDAAHSSGDVGVEVLTVRQDTPAALAGAAGDYQPLSTDALNNLRVILTRKTLPCRTYIARPANTTTYAAGEAISDTGGASTTISVGRVNDGTGRIKYAQVVIEEVNTLKADLELWLFNADPSFQTDNALIDFSDAEMRTLVCMIPLGNGPAIAYAGGGTPANGQVVYQAAVPDVPFQCVSGAATLFFQLVVRNAYVPAENSTRIDVTLGVEQD